MYYRRRKPRKLAPFLHYSYSFKIYRDNGVTLKKNVQKCHRTRQAGEGNDKKRTHKKWDAGGEGGWRGGRCLPFIKKSYITQEQTKNKHATQYMGTSKHRGKPWYPKRASASASAPENRTNSKREHNATYDLVARRDCNGSGFSKRVFRLCFLFFSMHTINTAASTCFKQPRLAIRGVAATPGSPRRREARPKLEHASNYWMFGI